MKQSHDHAHDVERPDRERRRLAKIMEERLLGNLEPLVEAYARRMRADARVPMARNVPNPQLEDHARSLLIDVFQGVGVATQAEDAPADIEASHLLEDGSRIQALISDLHGRQRHRLGWTREALEREYEILTEEVVSLARRWLSDKEQAVALDILLRSMQHAKDASFRGFAAAGAGS